jgi:hypothetical protein
VTYETERSKFEVELKAKARHLSAQHAAICRWKVARGELTKMPAPERKIKYKTERRQWTREMDMALCALWFIAPKNSPLKLLLPKMISGIAGHTVTRQACAHRAKRIGILALMGKIR